MKKIQVNASSPYEILIGKGLLKECGTFIKEKLKSEKLLVVTDDIVGKFYLETVVNSLKKEGFQVFSYVFPNGEQTKNMENLASLLEFLGEKEFTRTDALVALGGGVIGDLTGFASAVYLRGVPFVQLPTTLLAAVDSSVGGKTAVNLSSGKNLAGAFHQPALVLTDVDALETLPPEIFSEGCAEVIKYAVLFDRDFFDVLGTGIYENREEIIEKCCIFKKEVVEQDEFDKGQRQLLNLGHTVGHAIEACSHFQISHGKAVAMGMRTVTKAAVKEGLCPEIDLFALENLLLKENLPIKQTKFTYKELAAATLLDKKRKGEFITLVVPVSIGKAELVPLPTGKLEEFIKKGMEP